MATILRVGLSSSETAASQPFAISAAVTDDTLTVELADGRSVSMPFAWYPHLLNATAEERRGWRPVVEGEGITGRISTRKSAWRR